MNLTDEPLFKITFKILWSGKVVYTVFNRNRGILVLLFVKFVMIIIINL